MTWVLPWANQLLSPPDRSFRTGLNLEDLGRRFEEELLQGPVILQVPLGLAPLHLVERGLGDVQMSIVHHLPQMPEEKSEEQGSDVLPVHIRIGHDDDPVIPELADVELGIDPCPHRRDQCSDLRRREHFVDPRPLRVQDLAPEGEDRLEPPIAPLLGRAPRGISLYEKKLAQGRILLRAVGELPRQPIVKEGALSSGLCKRHPQLGGAGKLPGSDNHGKHLHGGGRCAPDSTGRQPVEHQRP